MKYRAIANIFHSFCDDAQSVGIVVRVHFIRVTLIALSLLLEKRVEKVFEILSGGLSLIKVTRYTLPSCTRDRNTRAARDTDVSKEIYLPIIRIINEMTKFFF